MERQLTWGETLLVVWAAAVITIVVGTGLRIWWVNATPHAVPCTPSEVEKK